LSQSIDWGQKFHEWSNLNKQLPNFVQLSVAEVIPLLGLATSAFSFGGQPTWFTVQLELERLPRVRNSLPHGQCWQEHFDHPPPFLGKGEAHVILRSQRN